MSYLIDGHNLIPKVQGLSLQNLDDEERLISLLQEFCRATRKTVEVYFDNAPAGQARSQKYGLVQAHFIRQGSSADQAIESRLTRLGKQARNWTVISSDRRVQTAAKAVHAKVITSEAFANLLNETRFRQHPEHELEPGLSDAEVEDWLNFFGRDRPTDP